MSFLIETDRLVITEMTMDMAMDVHKNSLDEDNIVRKGNNLKESKIWNKLYKFQKDAVIGAIEKIENHNGCIFHQPLSSFH